MGGLDIRSHVNQVGTTKNLFLLNFIIFLTFDLMLLGAGVRTMDAGLTCPDWPLCFGKLVPKYHFGVYLEFAHRVIAGLVGILYMFFFVKVWRKKEFSKIRLLSCVGLFFLIAQIIMGGLTVLKLLEAYIVTLHLSLAAAFLLTLVFIQKILTTKAEKAFKLNTNRVAKMFRGLTIGGILFVFLQIVLGGLVASTYSGLVCIDFPTCNGEFFPTMVGPIAIQMLHRFGAYGIATLVFGLFMLAIFCYKKIGLRRKQRVIATQIFFLVATQIYVGVMNLKLLMPALLSVFHLALALTILILFTQLYFTQRRAEHF